MSPFATPLLALGLCLAQEPTPIEVETVDRPGPVSYAEEILDILDAKCTGCHSSVLAENGLDMETVAAMTKGGKRGPGLVPGKADESLLFQMAAHRVEPVMPPRDKANLKPLTPKELGLLKLWIDQGAKDDLDGAEPAPESIPLGILPPGLHEILSADLTADGRRAAAGRANVVQVYDTDSGLEIARLGGHTDLIQSVRFSPDGKRLAAGSYQFVTVWEAPTGGPDRSFAPHGDRVEALATAPDGSFFATAALDGQVRLWDPTAEQPTRSLPLPDGAKPFALALSADGKLVAAGGSDGKVFLWNRADGALIRTIDTKAGQFHALAFSPTSDQLAVGSDDGKARVFALPADPVAPVADPVLLEGHAGPISGIAYSKEGARIVTASRDGRAKVWESTGGPAVSTIEVGEKPLTSLSVAPDGSRIAVGTEEGTARVFSATDGAAGPVLSAHTGPVRALAFSPTGELLATAGQEGGVKVWDLADGQGVIAFGHSPPAPGPLQPLTGVGFLGQDKLISSSEDRTARAWTFSGRWRLAATLGPHVFRVLALDFSPDGTRLATGGGEPSRSGEVKVWDLATGSTLLDLPEAHSDTVLGLRFSPDGTKLATGGADKFVRVLGLADGKAVRAFEGHTNHVMGVDWSADGKLVASASADNLVKFWDFESGEQVRTSQPAGNQITGLRWVAGKPIVLGSSGDKTARAWNSDNGQVARTFGGAADYLYTIACSADGSRVLAGGAEGVLYLWNGEDGQLLRKLGPGVGP